MPTRAVRLPYSYARLCAERVVPTVAILDGWPANDSMGWQCAPKPFPHCRWAEQVTHERLEPNDYREVADYLRCFDGCLKDDDPQEHETCVETLHYCVSLLDNAADDIIRESVAAKTRDQMTNCIHQVLLSDILRSDAYMRPALVLASRILLSSVESAVVEKHVAERRVMDRGTLSRSRFILDAAWMMFWREQHAAAISRGVFFKFDDGLQPPVQS